MEIDEKIIEKAYKKLKSSVYFDKTQYILRNSIVDYETSGNIDELLSKLYYKLLNDEQFGELSEKILESIEVSAFPKKMKNEENKEKDIIMNTVQQTNCVGELQYFIDMSVKGHILGVLWIMLIGYRIDKNIYEHSYGNRIRKNLINEFSDNPTYSPYLFEPYFHQYESWRDKAISVAEKYLSMDQDVVIITMDFKKYYYSIDADRKVFEELFKEAFPDENDEFYKTYKEILERINSFVLSVIEKYSTKFKGTEFDNRKILPIGFLPSNIIGNWCLKKFDKAITDGWNPVFYGRYVDDILIVDKIEHNSDIYKKAISNELTKDQIIEFLLTSCMKWNGMFPSDCKSQCQLGLLQLKNTDESGEKIYRVNPKYNPVLDNRSEITVQNRKLKLFYFNSKESDSLLTCFKENISKNKSEFRHLPEDEAVFQRDDYSEIYSIKSSETINKLRGIDGISIDKYMLSKFLGKYLRIGGMIQDKKESKFAKDIEKIFNCQVILENYTTWEKIIEVFIINEDYKSVDKIIEKIIDAIYSVDYSNDESDTTAENIKNTLYSYLHSILCRCFALVWKKECFNHLVKLYTYRKDKDTGRYLLLNYNDEESLKTHLKKSLTSYCITSMIDKSVTPIIISMINIEKIISEQIEINLTHFNDVLQYSNRSWDNKYKYFPFMVNMYDVSMITWVEEMKKHLLISEQNNTPFNDLTAVYEKQIEHYIKSNYCKNNQQANNIRDIVNINTLKVDIKQKEIAYLVSVKTNNKSKLKIAIANVKLNHENFSSLIKGNPNRTYSRYRDLSLIVNQAIDQNVDMLIMPEAFVPYEWISTLARTCAKNNLAIVTGIEYIKFNTNVYNYTAVILPYEEEPYKTAYISFHLKNHYAPIEIETIKGYGLSEVCGKHYELYKWNDCYFPVYCCFELASIMDRSLFQSYADFLVAVEWNKDVNYYSNILESLSRDIHCYCIQVNTSDFGDSRITKPTKTEDKDIIRTKGGINSSILVGTIDINALRDFQIKEYNLQSKDFRFKVTPPDFNRDVVMKKIKRESLF